MNKILPSDFNNAADVMRVFKQKMEDNWAHVADGFMKMDKDRSGKVDRQEIMLALDQLNIYVPAKVAKTFLDQIDKDGDGEVDFQEFANAIKGMDPDAHKEGLGQIWDGDNNVKKRIMDHRPTTAASLHSEGDAEDDIDVHVDEYYAKQGATKPVRAAAALCLPPCTAATCCHHIVCPAPGRKLRHRSMYTEHERRGLAVPVFRGRLPNTEPGSAPIRATAEPFMAEPYETPPWPLSSVTTPCSCARLTLMGCGGLTGRSGALLQVDVVDGHFSIDGIPINMIEIIRDKIYRKRGGVNQLRRAFMELDRCDLTARTTLQHDGPNHLGLRCNALPGQQMALITSGLCARQGWLRHHQPHRVQRLPRSLQPQPLPAGVRNPTALFCPKPHRPLLGSQPGWVPFPIAPH